MSSFPKISVIMSVYNDEAYLRQSIESILEQTYSDFEFLITDDASSDKSHKIIKEYASVDSRIKLFSNKNNKGLTKSLNQMLKNAQGELIARMDGDDIALKNRFEKQVSLFEKEDNIDLVFSSTFLIDKNGKKICETWRPDEDTIVSVLENHCYIPHPTIMAKKKNMLDAGGYNEEYITGQDKELWLRLRSKGVNFKYLPEVLLKYRLNPTSVRANESEHYWYKVAMNCIYNRQKLKALKFAQKLSLFKKTIIGIKILIPNFVYFYKQIRS